MNGRDREPTASQMRFRRPRPGDRVRITIDSLRDWTGTVVGLADNRRCILNLDGLAAGIRVILPFESLEVIRPVTG